MKYYLMVEYPTFMFYEGPFRSQDVAEARLHVSKAERPSAIRNTVVRTLGILPTGAIEFIPTQEKVVV